MSYKKKPFEELNVLDDFMFNALANDETQGEEFCRTILSVLLQRDIRGSISIVTQRTIPAYTPDLRGIRMDVEVEENENIQDACLVKNVYDVEPHLQTEAARNLVRHNRFYQARIDGRYMKRGERDFSKMPDLYMITITDYDPFGCGYMVYSVRNRCLEKPELVYDDGVQFLYFYTDGKKGGNTAIQTLLQYMKDSTPQNVRDETTQKVDSMMSKMKVQPEVKIEYMKFDDIIYYQRKDAMKDDAREFLKNGVSLEIVKKSMKGLSEEEIETVYEEVMQENATGMKQSVLEEKN